MKRKIAISTLAASMAATAFAGIPLSSKGLAEKVGIQVNVASAAEALDPAFVSKVNAIHAALEAGGGQGDVQALRTQIAALSSDTVAIDGIVEPVWSKISGQFVGHETEVQQALYKLVELVGISFYDPTLSSLATIRDDATINTGLELIEDAAGVGEITAADVIELINAVEASLRGQMTEIDDLRAFLGEGSEAARENLIRAVVADLKGQEDLKIIQALVALDPEEETPAEDVSVEDIVDVYNNFILALPAYEDAAKALGTAYARATSTSDGASNGLLRTYTTINVLGFEVPATLLTWTSTSGVYTSTKTNGRVEVRASQSGVDTQIRASFLGRVIFEDNIRLQSTVTPPPWNGGGGFPVTPGPEDPGTPVDVPGTVDAAIDELREILAGLEGATPAERAELIAKAIDAAVVAIDKISSYNGASHVTVADGVATANIPDAGLLAIIAGISEIKSTLESLAPGSTADLKPRVVIVNLGAVEQDQVSVTISQAVFAAARAAGVAGFEIVADRLSVTVPASTTFSGGAVNLSVERESPNSEPALTGVRTASSVYSFDLTVGGNTVTTFDRPVTLKVPVANTDGLDEELLSLAKIINDRLEFHGGFLRGQHIVEPRDSFSSYVIVENRVSFNDIGSVSAWAGRQIQVMAAKGAIQGRAAGQFVPRDNITRAEFAKMLVRAMNLENASATENFADVNAGDWFAPYVAAAADLGIINGRSATSFAPNALITRAEMATMLARTLKITHELEDVADVEGSLAAFIDAGSIHATLRSGVALAASKELIIGYQGNFLPNDNANRAEAAVMVYRAFNFTE